MSPGAGRLANKRNGAMMVTLTVTRGIVIRISEAAFDRSVDKRI